MEGQYRGSANHASCSTAFAALCEKLRARPRGACGRLSIPDEAFSGKCSFFHVFACFFGGATNFKNEEEGPFFLSQKRTSKMKRDTGPFFSFFGRIQKRCH